ncbi:MAG: FeoB-associated Cys-rich membrane protein [Brevinematales bacterium]|nr:FeoB-associated Cys-rich membrane protein [Brevinematales bacterium]
MKLTVVDIILMAVVLLLAVYILIRPFLKRLKSKGSQCASCPYCTLEGCPMRKIESAVKKNNSGK